MRNRKIEVAGLVAWLWRWRSDISGRLRVRAPQTTKGTVVEEIVARVNNQIITLSDYQKAAAGLQQEAAQDCQNCSPMQIQGAVDKKQKDLLRDMIDQQLLIERAKDMDVSVETDLVKRLDEVRKQNNLRRSKSSKRPSSQQGIVWEDYKTQLRNSC